MPNISLSLTWVVYGICISLILIGLVMGLKLVGDRAAAPISTLTQTKAAETASAYLGFKYNPENFTVTLGKYALDDLIKAINPNKMSVGGIDEIWTFSNVKFKKAAQTVETGVYKVVTIPADSSPLYETCRQQCSDSTLCRLFEVDETQRTCKLSTYNVRNLLTLHSNNIVASSAPFEKRLVSDGDGSVHVLLRRPIIVTQLHDSACDCNTICAMGNVRHPDWTFNTGGRCLGTLTNKGIFRNTCTGFTTHPQRLAQYHWQLDNSKWPRGAPSTPFPMFYTANTTDSQLVQYQNANHQKFCVCLNDPSVSPPLTNVTQDELNLMNFTCPWRTPDITTLLTDLVQIDK
jgi:hypothetical protein